jgi:HEAT repeat protein
MKFQTTAEALAVLQDTSRAEVERSAAIHFLAEDHLPANVEVLAQTLTDEDFGVRWAASNALIYAGQAAFKPILRVLVAHGATASVREVACHALYDNVDPQVRAASQELLHAMKGAGADAATPQVAFQMLRREELQPA